MQNRSRGVHGFSTWPRGFLQALRALVAGAVLAGLTAGAAHADMAILRNGDLLVGELQVPELPVSTPTGVVKVGAGDVLQVDLGIASGDVVLLRTGQSIGGVVDLGSYAIRLPWGQTIALDRADVSALGFTRR
jgi:hypothetical protein